MPAKDDCDDEDPTLGSKANDEDCDGVDTDEDCNDRDRDIGATSEDADCDGVLTADDCDDNSTILGLRTDDADCDGVLNGDDCGAEDPSNTTSVSSDGDCDGFPNESDCGPDDPEINPDADEICGNEDDENCDGRASFCPLAGDYDTNDSQIIWNPEGVGDQLGHAVAVLGDLDGDGMDDLVLGAPGYDTPEGAGTEDAGRVYLQYGRTESGIGSALTSAATWTGTTEERFGASFAPIGRLTGGDTVEFAAGAPYRVNSGYSYAGSTFILSVNAALDGTREGGEIDPRGALSTLSYASPNRLFGANLHSPGDVTGDGLADLIVQVPHLDEGSTSQFVLLFSGATLADNPSIRANFDTAASHTGMKSAANNEQFANTNALSSGDVDGDGVNEVIIGGGGWREEQGRVYVVESSVWPTYTEDPDPTPDHMVGDMAWWEGPPLTGPGSGTRFGDAVAIVPDIDGDGLMDLVVGAPEDDDISGYAGAGAAYVFYGSSALWAYNTTAHSYTEADLRVGGDAVGQHLGEAILGGADLDSDGQNDLILGAPGASGTAAGGGMILVYDFSELVGEGVVFPDDAAFRIHGALENMSLGYHMDHGDINGDGVDDLVWGAAGEAGGTSQAGVFFGVFGG